MPLEPSTSIVRRHSMTLGSPGGGCRVIRRSRRASRGCALRLARVAGGFQARLSWCYTCHCADMHSSRMAPAVGPERTRPAPESCTLSRRDQDLGNLSDRSPICCSLTTSTVSTLADNWRRANRRLRFIDIDPRPPLKPGSRPLVSCVPPEPSNTASNHSHCTKGAGK